MSIDYIVHLAFAYSNSLLEERYYKSRAAILARSGSICSASLTTLCSVLPLVGAKMLPVRARRALSNTRLGGQPRLTARAPPRPQMRQFGTIFSIVAVVSFAFTMLFFTPLLMITGPLTSRSVTQSAAVGAGLQTAEVAGERSSAARSRDKASARRSGQRSESEEGFHAI